MNYTVGKKLWFVPSRGINREATVTKVGRVWAHIDAQWGGHYRVKLGSTHVDGGKYSSPAKLYESEGDYLYEKRVMAAWDKFRRSIESRYRAPDGMTTERIAAACEALGIENPSKESTE